jgi:3-methyladenine DNA glycosylase AlkC
VEPMKNGLSENAVERIASAMGELCADFDPSAFSAHAMPGLETLELKERVAHLIAALHPFLPPDFETTARLLQQLPDVWDYGDPNDAMRGFAAWPLIDYSSVYGLEHPQVALETLKHLTGLFSAEFAIRPFLVAHPRYCQQQLQLWIYDESEHVRRLVSEGTRPRLPWGMQLKSYIQNPGPNLPLLNALKADNSDYVRRSVANHLNDIAKDHPDLVIDICRNWYPKASKEVLWVIKHATRTLVKSGHPDVFPLLGYSDTVELAAPVLRISQNKLRLGEVLEFQVELRSEAKQLQNLVVDFAIHFTKANGRTKPKVFKLKSIELDPGETKVLKKSHAIKSIATRKYYSGTQILEIMVNGTPIARQAFHLEVQ